MFYFYLILVEEGKPHGHQWNPVVEDKDASKATIIVNGESQDIDTGINRLENLLEGDFHIKEFKDEIIPSLSKTQVCFCLRNILQKLKGLRTFTVHKWMLKCFIILDQSCMYDASLN